MKVTIENIAGIYYINGKRLGHDTLLPEELQELDEFIKTYKNTNDEKKPQNKTLENMVV